MLLAVTFAAPADAYDLLIHQEITSRAIGEAVGPSRVLREDLGLLRGLDSVFRSGNVQLSARRWIEEGAKSEDAPVIRVLKHFHDPTLPWESAGLRLLPGSSFASSIVWGQDPVQHGGLLGGTWSWAVARSRYARALTSETDAERQQAFAETFRALGQVAHLVQDATVPAHTRNDPHPTVELGARTIPINPDWYEDWVEQARSRRAGDFATLFDSPVRPSPAVFEPTREPGAPVPIAGLIDTHRLAGTGLAPRLDDTAAGAAEIASASFLSRNTMFNGRPLPAPPGPGDGFFEPVGTKFRRYFKKVRDGVVEIQHFVAEGALYEPLRAILGQPTVGAWTLDDRVHQDYARALLPRAVGHSAALLDYFFRGRLDVDLTPDGVDPSLARVTGTNASTEPLVQGTVRLYAERPDKRREEVTPLDPIVVAGVGAGQALASSRFGLPADAERFVAVYQGALGNEPVTTDGRSPGAVIARVLGGVRVEEVFAAGDAWSVRTPRGAFPTPLATAEWDRVKWGDDDSVLVARTRFAVGQPARVESFVLQRQPGSQEPVTAAGSSTLVLTPRARATLPFERPPLVTTVEFQQTVRYRQQVGRYTRTGSASWLPLWPYGEFDGRYVGDPVQVSPIEFSTVHATTVRFGATIPILLDRAHSLDWGDLGAPYVWRLADVAAHGPRLLGLVVVHLTQPPVPPESVPFHVVTPDGGMATLGEVRIDPTFPREIAPLLWALVDLVTGEIVASTAEPTITIASDVDREGPPWDDAADALTRPGLYVHATTTFNGGPLGGLVVDDGWVPRTPTRRSIPPTIGVSEVRARVGVQALAADGWPRAELATALRGAGLLSFEVTESPRTGFYTYDCPGTIVSGDQDCLALRVVALAGRLATPPVQFSDALRARPAPGGERLVLFGEAERDTGLTAHLAVWDPEAQRASVRLQLPAGINRLVAPAASEAAMVFTRPRVGTRGSYWVPLDDARPPVFFPGADFRFGFLALAPDFLYGTTEQRFFRRAPPLQATALPLPLSEGLAGAVGDYHAIRLP